MDKFKDFMRKLGYMDRYGDWDVIELIVDISFVTMLTAVIAEIIFYH
jgi:hypothetical protein